MAIEYPDYGEAFGNALMMASLARPESVPNALAPRPAPSPYYNQLAAYGGPTVAAAAAGDMDEREWLARAIYSEAANEPFEGQIAVGSVIDNRRKSGQYPDDFTSVILQDGQFSAFNGLTGYAGGAGANDLWKRTPSAEAYAAADAILSGRYTDPTGGALNYYNPAVASPAWGGGDAWQRIGNHVFGTAG